MGETVQLHASDGHQLDAYVAKPQGEADGAVVVVQEIFGVNKHIRAVADRFAKEGYFAIAPALFDRVQKNVDLGYEGEDMQKARAFIPKLSIDNAVKDVDAALAFAREKTGKRAGVVGFCYGGTLAWLSATRLSPSAAVGYYGGQIAKFAEEKPRAPVMLHFGRQDTHIPKSDVALIEEAHPEVQVYWYDAGHGFNCDMRGSYDAQASREAWPRTLEFLKEHVAAPAKTAK
jgi:carboxymethylenebutenolidase